MLSFSTCWNSHRHSSAKDLVEEIFSLGIRRIELGHGLKAPLVADLLREQPRLGFEVSSLHCFCPLPPEVMTDNPDCYELTSHRPEDRRRAIRLAIQTVDMAERFGARAIVLHTGRIRTFAGTARLRGLAASKGLLSKAYAREKVRLVRRREAAGEGYLQRALEGLIEITDHAAKMGMRVGIENREDYEAVPSEREMENLLDRLDASNAGYWHDFGHAQIKDHLALLDHGQWLDAIGGRAIGCHVHDVRWPFTDHQPPFTGEVDFKNLIPKIPPNAEFVMEIGPRVSREAVLESLTRWKELIS